MSEKNSMEGIVERILMGGEQPEQGICPRLGKCSYVGDQIVQGNLNGRGSESYEALVCRGGYHQRCEAIRNPSQEEETGITYVPTGRVDENGVAETRPINTTPTRYFVSRDPKKFPVIKTITSKDKGNLVERVV